MARQKQETLLVEERVRSGGRPPRPFSLAGLTAVGVLAAAVVFGVVGLFVYQFSYSTAQRYLEQRTQTLASEVTYALAVAIQTSAAEVERAALEPYVIAALREHDQVGVANAELRLSKRFHNALRVRLLRPGANGAEVGAFPQLGYADLDMVHMAEASGKSPQVEAHLFGTEAAHIDVVKPVKVNEAGGELLLGHVLVSFSADLLRQAIDNVAQPVGYLEIRQRAGDQGTLVPLVARGDATLAAEAKQHMAPLAGTRWQLLCAPPAEELSELTWRNGLLWLVFAAGFLFLALILYGMYRVLSRALQADLETLIDVVRDARAGQPPQAEYPLHLKEFRGTVDVLSTVAHGDDAGGATPASGFTPAEASYVKSPSSQQRVQPASSSSSTATATATETSMVIPTSIFRAYDIRGVVGDTLTEEIVYEIGRALGAEAYARGQQSVVVARDGRLSGPALSAALSKGLRASGREVIDIGQVPTPVLYFATHYLDTGSGVMVTGSHNPADYNGLKMVLKGETLAEEDIQSLRRRIETQDYTHGSGSARQQDIVADYLHTITGDVQLARPLKVVVDCGNGVAGELAPRLLRALGCEVIERYCEIDGRFPNHHPDPSQLENLHDVIGAVIEQRADLGLAFDGDGDRVALIDNKGAVIWPDRQMIENGALLAGEMSGHIFFKERWFGFDDGLYTAARLLEILAADDRSVHDIFMALPDAISTSELRMDLREGEQIVFMKRLMETAQFKGAVLTTIDGIRADFEDGWGLVRASNTTPSLILRFEANTEAALKRIQNEFRSAMLKVNPALTLPF